MWLHCAPADDIIVVSEIGEQWSPQTAPARQADIDIMPSSLPTGKIAKTIGIKIPNVPQDVPVANAIPQATRKIIAGNRLCSTVAEPPTSSATYTSAPKSPVTPERVHAKVRIKMGETMALKQQKGILYSL